MTTQVYNQSVITFDGQDDYINFGRNDIGGVFAQGSSAFTVSGWINPQELKNQATTYGTHNVFFARSSDRYSDNFEFGISESGNIDLYIDEKVEKVIKTFGNGELTVGQWHFFAIVFNQGQLTIYIDEHEYFGYLTGDSLNKATSPVTLGATLHNSIYFTGQLAHISVWNYPCLPVEIQRHRSEALVGNEQGLVAYWILNEGEGTTVKDQTENTHNGTLHGNPSWGLAQIPFGITQLSNQSETTSNSQEEQSVTESATELTDVAVGAASRREADLRQSVEVPPEVENDVLATPTSTASTTQQRKGRKETKRQSENANIQTPQPKEEKAETVQTTKSQVQTNIQQPQTLTQERSQKTMITTANPRYKILSIDGGGIRGIIPALILAEIEKRTKKPIFSLFDLITGTSTGGILALGLTKPQLSLDPSIPQSEAQAHYTAEQLVKLYVEYGAEIFYEPFFEHMLGPLEDMFTQPKYASDGREEIIDKYFGNAPLENNLKEVFVTSYDIEQRIPIFFTNKIEKQQIESKKFRKVSVGFTLKDAAMATSATPTYFPPYRVATSHNPSGFYNLVDGGLVANNPASLAITEAKITRQTQKAVLHTNDILLVSLGTGSLTSVYKYNDVKNWGQLQWVKPLLNIVLDGGSEVVAGELEHLFESTDKEIRGSYYRFQTFLTGDLEDIDNVKSENIRQLQTIAHRLITEKSQQIDELCSILST
ncbi:patatin-like phospholipase family protein [Nostoc sp. CHAB 5836]|uniref:patatin-like phospholipase family protein n=1 Tax=Nostoc sp. CHAB 5836 TaxID=2780404 RepID=UPI001E52EBE4|nr:patatin-like phospholipase family protein [Nostoc sp. CHAB 5836]MCC5615446.1 patatin-like phospholipase family protein [Nostoc sp. CHAB 5836]